MRISDWSSDVCSSDLAPRRTAPALSFARRKARPSHRSPHAPSCHDGDDPMTKYLLGAASVIALTLLAACGNTATPEKEGAKAAAGEYDRGPHRGRLLRDGQFAPEITLFEDGVDPELRVHDYRHDKQKIRKPQ